MKFNVITLGCFRNVVDSELLIQEMSRKYTYVTEKSDADIIIINTCSFIEAAKQESIDTILCCAEHDALLIVAGCLGQHYGAELMEQMPEVDGVVGTYAYRDIMECVQGLSGKARIAMVGREPDPGPVRWLKQRVLTPSHYAFVKIADGCNRKCSFCVIPSLKGMLKSRPLDAVVEEVKILAEQGVKEVNIISQDTTSYGRDRYGKPMLVQLLSRLTKLTGVEWIRLLYNHPADIDRALLSLIVESEKLCNYLDVPVQHISSRILRAMKREGASSNLHDLFAMIHTHYPEIRLRTTLMVGFPGETEEEFGELCRFVKETEFDRLGVFCYSREEGTASYGMAGQLTQGEKRERQATVMKMQAAISLRKNRAYIGKTLPVLIDGKVEGAWWEGRTEFDAPEIDNGVLLEGSGDLAGRIIPVEITDAAEYDLIGRFARKRSGT